MDDISDQQDEPPDRSLRKCPFIPKGLGHSLPRSGSILDILKRSSQRKLDEQEPFQTAEKGSSQQRGTRRVLPRRSAMSSEVPNRQRSIVQEHHLMKPLQPPIPKSKTLGSLETDLLFTTPETSPPRSLRTSIGPSFPRSPEYSFVPLNSSEKKQCTQATAHWVKPPSQRLMVKHTDGTCGSASADNTIFFQECSSAKASLPLTPGKPFNVNSDIENSFLVRRHTLDSSQASNMADRVSSLGQSSRHTQSPTQIPQPRFNRKSSIRKYSPSVEDIPPVPPIPASVRSLGRVATPRTILPPRKFSTRVVSTPPGRNSWIPTPVHPPRYVSTPNVSTSKLSTPSSKSPKSLATRIPTPVQQLPRHRSSYALRSKSRFYPYSGSSLRRYSPRPGYDASEVKLPTPIRNPRVTPPSAKTCKSVSSFSSEATAIEHVLASSPTPNVGRKGNGNARIVSDASSVRRPSKSSVASPVNLNKPLPDPVAIAARREAELNGHVGMVDEAMPTQYWVGRFMGKSDRLRTQELEVKAAIAAAGDPGEADHPANTGMFDDDLRERYVIEYLTTNCANEEALASLQAFQKQRLANKKGSATAKGPMAAATAGGSGPSKAKKE